MKLQRRISLVLIPTVALPMGAAAYLVLASMQRYHGEQMRQTVLGLARTVTLNLREERDLSDARRLYSFIRNLQASDPRTLDAMIVDGSGEITGDLDEDQVFSRSEDADIIDVLKGSGTVSRVKSAAPGILEATVPIYYPGSESVLGAFRLRYDTSSLQAIHRAALLKMFLTITGITVLLILALRLVLAHQIVKPLEAITGRARALSEGDLAARVPRQRTHELALLRASFNTMASSLQESLASLEIRREALEAMVGTRTAELSAAKLRLERVNEDLEERVRERTGQLLHSERLAAIGTLASGVAHEINGPLATILACAEGLARSAPQYRAALTGASGDKLESYLTIMRDEALRCRDITSQLLDYSRKRATAMTPLDLRHVIDGAVALVQPRAATESKSVMVALPGHPLSVRGEPGALKQLLVNLLINALDASPKEARVAVRGFDGGGSAHVEVADEGRGLSPEELSRAFEPFFTTKSNGHGTGLGLAICDVIVHQHAGSIVLHSAGRGRGARVIVTLPLDPEGSEIGDEEDARPSG